MALSRGFPRVGSPTTLALRCPDFPRGAGCLPDLPAAAWPAGSSLGLKGGAVDAGKTAGDYIKPALYLNDEMRLEEALRRMQRSGQRLAIVLGRDQRELGIVSLQDILKFIFGEVSL